MGNAVELYSPNGKEIENRKEIENGRDSENGKENPHLLEHSKFLQIPRRNYVPPLNFSLVENGIYRSGFPMPINYPFLEQLKINTIIYLGDLGSEKPKRKDKKEKGKEKEKEKEKEKKEKRENQDPEDLENDQETNEKSKEKKPKKEKHGSMEIYENYTSWIKSTNIKFHHLVVHSSQEPFALNTEETQKAFVQALELIVDRQNFPILIHSNKGKHRIGVLVGLMRKILQGWCMSGIFEEYEKFAMGKSEHDLEFIELWQPELIYDEKHLPDFVRV